MTRPGARRFLSPTLLAFIVAGGVTAALASLVLSAGTSLMPERPEPVGTAIAAPTEQALATVEPTQPAAQDLTPTPGNDDLAITRDDERPESPDPTTAPEPTSVPENPPTEAPAEP